MKYTMLPNRLGVFAWSDVPDCYDIQTGRKIASQFTALVFSEINSSADLNNGDLTEVTMDCTLNDDLPEDWMLVSKNEDGTERIEIQAHVCAVPEPICQGLTVMRFPVWSNEPVGIPLGKCVAVIPRVKIDEM
jgi:hypothetical protein